MQLGIYCVCVCWQKGLLFENVKHATRNIGFFHYSILVTGWDAKIFDPRWGVNHWKNDHHFFNNKSCRWTGWVVVTPPPEQLLKKMLNGLEWRIKIGDATTNAFFYFLTVYCCRRISASRTIQWGTDELRVSGLRFVIRVALPTRGRLDR